MIYLTNALKNNVSLDDNSMSFLDFIGTKYKIEENKSSIFFIGDKSFQKDYDVNLYVFGGGMNEVKNEILDFAQEWKEISIRVMINGLTPGNEYYPIHSTICNKGFNWVKEFAKENNYPFKSPTKKEFIEWYKQNDKRFNSK